MNRLDQPASAARDTSTLGWAARACQRIGLLATAATCLALAAPPAQAAVVKTPAGVVAGTSGGRNDSAGTNKWRRINVRQTSSYTGITSTYPRLGDGGTGQGSAELYLENNLGKADWSYAPTGGFGTLGQFTSLSYDWYRGSDSTVK